MARPIKMGLDYFPACKPHMITLSKLGSIDKRVRYKTYRSISSSFIAKKDVRDIVFADYGHKCAICGNTEFLQIDHIVSVYEAYKRKLPIDELNSRYNLQVLCRNCNSSKKP